MKKLFGSVLILVSLSGCALFRSPAVLDPLVAACAQDLSQWSVIIDAAKTMNLTAMQLATAVCEIPVIVAPYAQKQANAKELAQKAYLGLNIGDLKSIEATDAGATDAGATK
jgi:hypothetical protein